MMLIDGPLRGLCSSLVARFIAFFIGLPDDEGSATDEVAWAVCPLSVLIDIQMERSHDISRAVAPSSRINRPNWSFRSFFPAPPIPTPSLMQMWRKKCKWLLTTDAGMTRAKVLATGHTALALQYYYPTGKIIPI